MVNSNANHETQRRLFIKSLRHWSSNLNSNLIYAGLIDFSFQHGEELNYKLSFFMWKFKKKWEKMEGNRSPFATLRNFASLANRGTVSPINKRMAKVNCTLILYHKVYRYYQLGKILINLSLLMVNVLQSLLNGYILNNCACRSNRERIEVLHALYLNNVLSGWNNPIHD